MSLFPRCMHEGCTHEGYRSWGLPNTAWIACRKHEHDGMNHAIMVWREHEKSLFLAKEQEKANKEAQKIAEKQAFEKRSREVNAKAEAERIMREHQAGKPNTGLSRFKKKYAKPIAA